MLPPVKPVPSGFHTVTPHLCVKDAPAAIEFYKKAFGADELTRIEAPGGTVMHCELAIGDSIIMLNEEHPEMGVLGPAAIGGTPVAIHLYVEDADAWFARATEAGAETVMPLADMFWGDRYGMVADPYGHRWGIGTHIEDLTPEEIEKRQAAAFSQSAS